MGMLVCITSCLVLTKCSREYSAEGVPHSDTVVHPPMVAAYTLAGSPDACSGAFVAGTYIVDQPLANLNTADLQVTVTQTGSYTIKTDTVNGMSFSATGEFTRLGKQTVRLVAAGKPVLAGLFSFLPKAPSSNCSFEVGVQNREPLATYVLESGYGNPNPCIYTIAGSYHTQTPLTNANSVSMSVYVQQPGNFTIQTSKVNGMVFSASGNFTNTGSQYITLTGSGIPVTAGRFTLIPQIIGPHPLGGESCALPVTVQ